MRRISYIVVLAIAMGCDSKRTSLGNAARGRDLVERYRCQACHFVPGVPPVAGTIAPSLDRFARREIIAGRLPNTPSNLAAYLENPRIVDPSNTMPDLDMSSEDTRDVTAFLMTLR